MIMKSLLHSNIPARLVALLGGTLFAAAVSSAETIQINLGGIDATPELPTSDGILTNWNDIVTPNTGLASVIDSNGLTVAGVSVSTSGFSTSSVFDNNTSTSVYGSGGTIASWLDTDAVELPWYSSGTVGTIVISGLTAPSYTVDFVAARSSAGGDPSERTADYQLNGAFATSSPDGDGFNSYLDGWVNGSIITWENVAPISGELTLTGSGTPNGHYDAIRITAVPEPSMAAALMGLAGLLFLGIRRRK